MAKSLIMVMFVSLAILFIARPIFSQEIDANSDYLPEDIAMSPSEFDMIFNRESQYADSPAVTNYKELIQHYFEKEFAFLAVCVMKLSDKCHYDIEMNLSDETTLLTDECCRDLLKFGKDCHVAYAQNVYSSYEYDYDRAAKVIPKMKQTWNDCVHRVGSQIGVLISLEE